MIIFQNEIFIKTSPEKLFRYVTQPWYWHDWHPSSLSAKSDKQTLALGDHFTEVIKINPLSPLPLSLKRKTQYKVTIHVNAKTWEVKGTLDDGWLIIHYDFIPKDDGTLFKRKLTIQITGYKKFFLPFILRRRMEALSVIAMQNLKNKMEKG